MSKRKLHCLECGTALTKGRMMYNHVHRCTTIASATTTYTLIEMNNDEDEGFLAAVVHPQHLRASNSQKTQIELRAAAQDHTTNNEYTNFQACPSDENEDDPPLRRAELEPLRTLDPDMGISTLECEVLQFLAIVEKGQGMSRNQATDVLAYLHTFNDPRVACLPKTLEYCWQIVHQVMLLICIITTIYSALNKHIVHIFICI